MTSKKLPPHGSESRYRTCRCTDCRRAQTQACQRRELAHLAGRSPLFPREVLAAHIERLHKSGMCTTNIARQAGVPEATLRDFVRGRTQRIGREQALKVMAVPAGSLDVLAWHQPIGTERRVRALYARGHSSDAIAAETGLSRSVISAIAHGHKRRLSGYTVQAVAAAYPRLAARTGTSAPSLRAAKKGNWPGPGWWDDETIDDPAARPEQAVEMGRNELAAYRRQEIAHLAGFGIPERDIAARLDMAPDYVHDLIRDMRTAA